MVVLAWTLITQTDGIFQTLDDVIKTLKAMRVGIKKAEHVDSLR